MKYSFSYKLFIFSFLFSFFTLPVVAETKPDDLVGIYQFSMENEKSYFKKWKDIKLDNKNKKEISKIIKKFEEDGEKFRVDYIFLANGDLTRIKFDGDLGSVVMMDWPKGTICSLNFTSNGGYAGINNQACTNNDE
ncbi:MAG: hypothetical protein ACK4IX_09585 [Candidatus Sericytochromatia bacterium]